MDKKEKVILIIRDGWGFREEKTDNAIATTPLLNTTRLMKEYPNVLLNTSGLAVGLPEGYTGNSEVGHMTIGAGRIFLQSLVRINKTIENKSFFRIPEFVNAIENCKKNNSKLHLIGLLQTEGVHSHRDHLFALLDLCKQKGFHNVLIHVITDGRDAPIQASINQMTELNNKIKEIGFGTIATVSGRYYAMDRDKRWERTKQAYDCIVKSESEEIYENAVHHIKDCHNKNMTDEFIIPAKEADYPGIKNNDSIIFYNFRTDRTRQLTQAIVEPKFDGWERKPLQVCYVAMTQFYSPMNAGVAFKDQPSGNLLGEVLSKNGISQLRISETEKYAHVTFFFNDQIETPNAKEDRILVPSPKVATYDLKPEMSVYELTEKLVEQIHTRKYDFIVTNLVNGDMVGHTGIIEAIKKALIAIDDCLGKIVKAGLEEGYTLMIFADHGNAEDQTEQWRTSHTLNPVPFILVSDDSKLKSATLKTGKGLQDIAPTVLDILNIKKPAEMTGESLIK